MKLKGNNVWPAALEPAVLLALFIADQIWNELGQELVVTSLNDSTHSETSLHYIGNAADLRTRYFTDEIKEKAAAMLKEKLNKHYDVVVEKTHIHLEYQPKNPHS